MTPRDRLQLLEHFFGQIDDPDLLAGTARETCRNLRREAAESLVDLLLNHRPFLEEERGLAWPYRELAKRVRYFESRAGQAETAAVRDEARLFLALLPFPGQWRWLRTVAEELEDDPEVKEFLAKERTRVAGKIKKKRQEEFKLHHFCQILKRPNLPGEKGILRIFSLPYLFADGNLLKRLSRLYVLYVEPPWGVLLRHAWLRVFTGLDDPVVFGVGGSEDRAFLAGQDGIVTTGLAHGDYLEEGEDSPPAATGEFDLVFNGTFDEMGRKRHAFMLDMLSRPPLDRTTALFIGRGRPENVETFHAWVAARGLGQRVAVLANLTRREVPEQLVRARIGVLTSQNENGCRCIYEYFRADLPCVVTTSMAGFNFALINHQNGIAVPDKALPEAIRNALAHRERFSSRAWFLNHSGSRLSSLRLNGEMKTLFARLGYSWQEDIVPLGSSGANRYVNESDHAMFRAEFEQLLGILQAFLPVRLSL